MSEGPLDNQASIMQFASLGMLGAVALLVPLGAGVALDEVLNTLPLLTMVGLVVGIVLAVLAVRAQLRQR